jgi:hypothetical protein
MSSKLTIPGAWTTPAFDAANFTGAGSLTWTVGAGDVAVYAYTIVGKTMTVAWALNNTTIGGTPGSSQIQIKIPASKVATKAMFCVAGVLSVTAWAPVFADVAAGGSTINIAPDLSMGGSFNAGSDNTSTRGNFTFEIN